MLVTAIADENTVVTTAFFTLYVTISDNFFTLNVTINASFRKMAGERSDQLNAPGCKTE